MILYSKTKTITFILNSYIWYLCWDHNTIDLVNGGRSKRTKLLIFLKPNGSYIYSIDVYLRTIDSYSLINFLICCCSPQFAQIWCSLDAVPSSWVGILGLKGMPSNKFQVSVFMPMTELTVLFHPGTFLHFLDLSLAAAILFCSFPSTLFSPHSASLLYEIDCSTFGARIPNHKT